MQVKFLNCVSGLILLSLVSCKTMNVDGQIIKDADIDYLKRNALSEEQVIDHLGTPNLVPEYSPNVWYYVYTKTTKNNWTLPKLIEQRIVKVTFNNSRRVSNVSVIENGFDNNVGMASAITPTPGTEQSQVQEFVKNIGRFNKYGNKKKKK